MPDFRFVLKPEFQKELFSELLDRYGRHELSQKFSVHSSTLYHYKNNKIHCISSDTMDIALYLSQFPLKKFLVGIKSIKNFDKETSQMLAQGRTIRQKQIQDLKDALPIIRELVKENYIDFERWFLAYTQLSFSGVRTFSEIKIEKYTITATYFNYSAGKKKTFTVVFPRKFYFDQDFQYFLGLWTGDRVGKGRFGICNNNKKINFETKRILEQFYQKPIFALSIHNDVQVPILSFPVDKVYISHAKTKIKGWGVWVYSQNATLFRFFDFLIQDLDYLLSILPQKEIFFAGLFDAEGNVNLEDSCLKWACKNFSQVEVYKKHLSMLGLYNRYDGCSLVCKDYTLFDELVFPYVRHSSRIRDFHFMMYRSELLNARFLRLLQTIGSSACTQKELAKALNREKIYAQLAVLENHGYIEKNGYPYRIFLTEKGLKELESGGKDINNDNTNPLSSAAVNQ